MVQDTTIVVEFEPSAAGTCGDRVALWSRSDPESSFRSGVSVNWCGDHLRLLIEDGIDSRTQIDVGVVVRGVIPPPKDPRVPATPGDGEPADLPGRIVGVRPVLADVVEVSIRLDGSQDSNRHIKNNTNADASTDASTDAPGSVERQAALPGRGMTEIDQWASGDEDGVPLVLSVSSEPIFHAAVADAFTGTACVASREAATGSDELRLMPLASVLDVAHAGDLSDAAVAICDRSDQERNLILSAAWLWGFRGKVIKAQDLRRGACPDTPHAAGLHGQGPLNLLDTDQVLAMLSGLATGSVALADTGCVTRS